MTEPAPPLPPGQCFAVGGSVRDELLGLGENDRDWVVVGATPQAMVDAGYRPVGRDFPVFLHPHSNEEFALARTERKRAPGYRGFVVHAAPEVTLEEDLGRRDLTINAMARARDGRLIDPYGGERDLRAGVLRHVSAAFAEDPVRLLRLARFAARWPAFTVAPETSLLLKQLVSAGEVDALVGERVWQELSRGLMEARPSRMLEVLHDCAALARLLPGIAPGADLKARLDAAAGQAAPLVVRYALLVQAAPRAAAAWRVPVDAQGLADVLARESGAVAAAAALPAAGLLALIERCDALRRPRRFAELLLACGIAGAPAAATGRATAALAAAQAIDTAAIVAQATAAGASGPAIGAAVRAARLAAIQG